MTDKVQVDQSIGPVEVRESITSDAILLELRRMNRILEMAFDIEVSIEDLEEGSN